MFPTGLTPEQIHVLVVSEQTALFALCVPQVINVLMLSRLAPYWRISERSKMRPVLVHARRHFGRDVYGTAVLERLVCEAGDGVVSAEAQKLWPYYPRGIDAIDVTNIAPQMLSRILSRSHPFGLLERIRLPLDVALTHEQTRELACAGFTGIIMSRPNNSVISELRSPLALLHVTAHSLSPSDMTSITSIPSLRVLHITAPATVVSLQQMTVSLVDVLRIRDCAGVSSSRGSVLETLRTLEISGIRGVDDSIWVLVAQFAPQLESLAVENYPLVHGRGVSSLHKCRRLKKLSVGCTSFDGVNVAAINALVELRHFSVHCTRVTRFETLTTQLRDHPNLETVTHSCVAEADKPGAESRAVTWVSVCVADPRSAGRAATVGSRSKQPRPSIIGTFREH
jgi:hypothetical protein